MTGEGDVRCEILGWSSVERHISLNWGDLLICCFRLRSWTLANVPSSPTILSVPPSSRRRSFGASIGTRSCVHWLGFSADFDSPRRSVRLALCHRFFAGFDTAPQARPCVAIMVTPRNGREWRRRLGTLPNIRTRTLAHSPVPGPRGLLFGVIYDRVVPR